MIQNREEAEKIVEVHNAYSKLKDTKEFKAIIEYFYGKAFEQATDTTYNTKSLEERDRYIVDTMNTVKIFKTFLKDIDLDARAAIKYLQNK